MRHIIKSRRNPSWKGDEDAEGDKIPLTSKFSALFPFHYVSFSPSSFCLSADKQ